MLVLYNYTVQLALTHAISFIQGVKCFRAHLPAAVHLVTFAF